MTLLLLLKTRSGPYVPPEPPAPQADRFNYRAALANAGRIRYPDPVISRMAARLTKKRRW
jgi:hypothetical protein